MKSSVSGPMVIIESVFPLDLVLVGRGLVYAIVCDTKRLVLVGYTTNLYQAIGRLMQTLETGSSEWGTLKEDLPQCRLVILETVISEGDTKKLCIKYATQYKEKGYSLYKDWNPVLYTLVTEMNYHHGQPYLFVYVRSKRGDLTTVGMFKRKKEMKEWIRLNYPDSSRIGRIVVHESMLECKSDSGKIKKSSSA